MISGTFSLHNSRPAAETGAETYPHGITDFHHISADCFSGGFFLNDRLPYTERDVYFNGGKEDIIVLLWGTVFNRSELKEKAGIDVSVALPELVAAMFLKEGPCFVSGLNGDFVIFLGRPSKKEAWLFRDHAGIRPLAYCHRSGSLLFSSDINGLCSALSEQHKIDGNFLLRYFKYIDNTGTPDKDVRRLPPGCFLHFSKKGVRLTRYWDPQKIRHDNHLTYERMLSDLKYLVADAVSIRCDGRFTAGAHVSSGLDSGIVAMLARREYGCQEPFYGFSWSPAEFNGRELKYDERDLVRIICEKAGITPVFMDLTTEGFVKKISSIYSNQGHFFEERVMEQAADRATNLLFSGWGGDEFISTGDRGIETDLLMGLHLRTYFRRNPVRPFRRFIKYFLRYTLLPALGILQADVAKSFRDDVTYIRKPFKKSERKALRNFYFHLSRRQLHLRYLKFYHLQERCEIWAADGFIHGVEYRFPLLDRRIIEYILKVPSLLLCRTDHFRPLLRVIGEGILPEEIRINNSKRDPVYSAWWDELLKASSDVLMDEVYQWRENKDLYFVDFELLERDIAAYRKDTGSVDAKVLFKTLVYLKGTHHFSLDYHAIRTSA